MEEVQEFPKLGNVETVEVVLTAHAIARVKARFRMPDEAIQEFVEEQLSIASTARKRRGGVVRWSTDSVQIVGRYTPTSIEVITCYPKSKSRGWGKKRRETWRNHERD